MINALKAISQAGSDLSLIKGGFVDETGSAKRIREIMNGVDGKNPWTNPNEIRHGMTLDEAEMLLELTEEGVLTPSLINQLTGAARTGKRDNKLAAAADKWMFLFSKTEQFNRRVTALASYRLEKARMLEASGNKTLTEADKIELIKRADRAVDASQGNYEKFNHPSIAQGPMLKYLWIYKQFQAITIQLMRHLGHRERVKFLALFVIMAGLRGIPFEEDFEDLVDTLMQKFGINWHGLEAEISIIAQDFGIPPGLLFRGPFDYYLGFTWSSRIGQANLIPGSGFFKAGASFERESRDIMGPVTSAWGGILSSLGTVGQYALESVGLRDDTTTLKDVLRTGGGLSALKNYARGIIYAVDGSITNDRGQVVSKDANLATIIFQLMGFYPGAATAQYDVNRMTNEITEYSKVLTARYAEAYVKANASGRRNILRQVREWNRDVGRKSPLYIPNFSGRMAKKSTASAETSVERTLKAAPTQIKPLGKLLKKGRITD